MIYAVGYNVFATLWNVIASFAEFFANVWNDPLRATQQLFFDVFDAILGIVETVAGAIDSVLGTNMQGAVSNFRSFLNDYLVDNFGENEIKIKRKENLDVAATASQFGDYGSDIGAKLDNMNFSLEDIAKSAGGLGDMSDVLSTDDLNIGNVGSVGNVKNVEGEVSLSDEDLKMYRDFAEMRYMNKVELKTLAPNIKVEIPEGSGSSLTAEDVADKIKAMLIEEMSAGTVNSHG